jgi:asparagine synthase (glutamine-hydrolysing)
VDRMSMANSLEVRSPLLDHQLAELAMSIPHQWNMRNGKGKQTFLKAVGHRLPPELLSLRKKGFGVPLALWFRSSLRTLLWDVLTSRTFLDRNFVSEEFLLRLLKEHDKGRRDNSHWLWRLLMLELWMGNMEQIRSTSPHFSRLMWQKAVIHGITEFPDSSFAERGTAF